VSRGSPAHVRAEGSAEGVGSMLGLNELVLVGTGFVLARVIYLFYFAPKKDAQSEHG
jgi:hypothetical protein